MKTNHTKFVRALITGLSFVPALTYAHPGHSAFDPAAAVLHPGHEAEYLVVAGLILVGFALTLRAFLKRGR